MLLLHSCFFSHRIYLHDLTLSAITVSLHYLTQMSAFNGHMRQNAYCGNIEVNT